MKAKKKSAKRKAKRDLTLLGLHRRIDTVVRAINGLQKTGVINTPKLDELLFLVRGKAKAAGVKPYSPEVNRACEIAAQ